MGDATTLFITLVVTRGPCASDPVTVPVEVPREPGETLVPPDLSDDALTTLKQRSEGLQANLATLAEENAGLSDTKSFSLANEFVQLDVATLTDRVVAQFEEVMTTVIPALKRAIDPQRQDAFAQLVEAATHSLFDKLVVNAPTAAEEAVIKDQLAKINEMPGRVRATHLMMQSAPATLPCPSAGEHLSYPCAAPMSWNLEFPPVSRSGA